MARRDGKVLLIGAGGLGSPVSLALARAGVALSILDDDVVSPSNLQRQVLFRTADVGRPKAEVAAERLAAVAPGARVEVLRRRFTPETALDLVAGVDLVVDGSDNFPTRFLANDACVLAGKPLVHGGILGFTGQTLLVSPGEGGCYRCLFEDLPPAGSVPSCAEAGVLGALCGTVGGLMAALALRVLAGDRSSAGVLTVYEALAGRTRRVTIGRDPGCAVCGEAPAIRSLSPDRYVEPAACGKEW
jgi:molybdopterin/thiamine biosynthesis adenylyltransferase